MRMRKCVCGLVLGLIALPAGSIWASTPNATLTGNVYDVTNHPLAGATVRLLNSFKGSSQVQVTGPDGGYTFNEVAPTNDEEGEHYLIIVELSGFKTQTIEQRVRVGDEVLVEPPFRLEPVIQAATPETTNPPVGAPRQNPPPPPPPPTLPTSIPPATPVPAHAVLLSRATWWSRITAITPPRL